MLWGFGVVAAALCFCVLHVLPLLVLVMASSWRHAGFDVFSRGSVQSR